MSEETPIAKLRNQLSPYYSLPDMILNMDAKPEMKLLLIEQAKRAKNTNERIKELLVEIEEHCEKNVVVSESEQREAEKNRCKCDECGNETFRVYITNIIDDARLYCELCGEEW